MGPVVVPQKKRVLQGSAIAPFGGSDGPVWLRASIGGVGSQQGIASNEACSPCDALSFTKALRLVALRPPVSSQVCGYDRVIRREDKT
jgi:hypothetical protein